MVPPNIILCIPGRFGDGSGVSTLSGDHGGLSFKRGMVVDRGAGAVYQLQIRDRDPRLPRGFAQDARQSLDDAELRAIAAHSQVAYLVGTGGSSEAAASLLRAGAVLLDLGGAAVRVDSAALAHGAITWQELAAQAGDAPALYRAYVGLVGNGAGFSSCGMHNLGLPDATVGVRMAPEAAATLLETFLLYLLAERPFLHDGHGFSLDAASPAYRLSREDCTAYPPDDPCFNPYGIWRMRA